MEQAMSSNNVEWVSLKELLKVLRDMSIWTIDTKYLNIYLDTRFIDGDWHCTVRDRENNRYLSIKDLKRIRGVFNENKQ